VRSFIIRAYYEGEILMPTLGSINQIWRYPIKSMGGERLDHSHIGLRGILGDRGWAVRDETAGEIRGAKKIPKLLRCTARYLAEPSETMIPPAEITLPDGVCLRSDDPEVAARLSHGLGRSVSLWPLQPATALDHYRRRWPDDPDLMKELRDLFGRL